MLFSSFPLFPLGIFFTALVTTKVPILEGYGLTETSPVATTNPVDLKEFTGTIGLPAGWKIDGSYRGTVFCDGPESQKVIMGMAFDTLFASLLIPVSFYAIERLSRRREEQEAARAPAQQPVPASR